MMLSGGRFGVLRIMLWDGGRSRWRIPGREIRIERVRTMGQHG